jgi:hypothetical protein
LQYFVFDLFPLSNLESALWKYYPHSVHIHRLGFLSTGTHMYSGRIHTCHSEFIFFFIITTKYLSKEVEDIYILGQHYTWRVPSEKQTPDYQHTLPVLAVYYGPCC